MRLRQRFPHLLDEGLVLLVLPEVVPLALLVTQLSWRGLLRLGSATALVVVRLLIEILFLVVTHVSDGWLRFGEVSTFFHNDWAVLVYVYVNGHRIGID